jgi:hypothetical protein
MLITGECGTLINFNNFWQAHATLPLMLRCLARCLPLTRLTRLLPDASRVTAATSPRSRPPSRSCGALGRSSRAASRPAPFR